MVEGVSLFPLAAGILAAMLATMAVLVPGRRSDATVFFVLFNVGVASWAIAYFAELNWGHYPDPALAPWVTTPDSLLLVLTAFGVAAAPTYWFLFAAADSHTRFWLSTPGLLLAHVPMAYTVAAGLTNPFHHLFLSAGASGHLVGGPLRVPYYLLTYTFVIAGTWLLVDHALAPGTAAGRRQAALFVAAPAVLMLVGIVYAFGPAVGILLPINPTPGLFSLLSLVLAYQVLRGGLASIVPLSTLSAIMDNTASPLAYLDGRLRFVSVNSAFVERSGHVEAELVGTPFHVLFPDSSLRLVFDAVKRTGEPAGRRADPTMLAEGAARRSYWNWSLSPVKDERGETEGFVLSLVDVSEEILERDLGNALETLSGRLHAGFASDATLCDTLAAASEDLGFAVTTLVLRRDGGWRMRHHCERTTSEWEPFDADVFEHLTLAMRTRQPVLLEDAEDDRRVSSSLMHVIGVRAALVVPLLSGSEEMGVLAFVDPDRPRHLTRVRVEFARRFAAAIVSTLENRRVYEGERRIAETLQESMLTMPLSVPGIDFAHRYRSATEAARVGGDFYDVFELDGGRVAVLIGDIAGHGIEAAVATSLVKNTIRAHAFESASPAEVMDRTNEVVRRQMEPGLFATACFSVLDPRTGELAYCNAGHPPTLIKAGAGGVRELPVHSTVLGALPNVRYAEGAARLEPDDVLVLYTDGVIEARRHGGGEFGEERLIELLADEPAHEPTRLVDRIYDGVVTFADDELSDDMALLAVRIADGTGGVGYE